MRRHLATVFAIGFVLVLAGCGRGAPTGTPSTPASPTPGPTVSPTTIGPTPSASTAGPVWPIETRTLPALGVPATAPPVLRDIATGQHGTYERLVLTFRAAYGAVSVRYVPVVRADPRGDVVPLRGNAYLQITVQSVSTGYTGPTVVTPGYPTLEQVAVSGDFEGVLSIGVGLDRVAGFQLSRLRDPDRLVLDVAVPPAWRMWPDDGLDAARGVQDGFLQGHQPWRGDATAVADLYGRLVYGWDQPLVTQVGQSDWYGLAAPGSADTVTVHVVWPLRTGSIRGICEIADTR